MSPTFRELRDQLNTLSDEQLDCNISVYDSDRDEYFPAKKTLLGAFEIADEGKNDGILDDGHPFIMI